MKQVLLITNPIASRHDPAVPRIVASTLASLGMEVDVAGTTRHGDAARIAAQGVADGADVIAVYGGDGTTMQAVSGMIGSSIPLALIPGGTGNLLAGNLRLPNDPAKAARVIAEGVRRPIDVGRIERPEGARHFAVASGAGVDALVMKGATTALKRRWGMGAYVLSAFGLYSQIRPASYRITVDGQVLEMDAITVVIANCGEVGRLYFNLGEDIVLDDGWLNVLVVGATGVASSLAAMWELYRGSPTTDARILRTRGRAITIEADNERPVQMDGELAGMTPITASVMGHAIDVLVPSGVVARPAGPAEQQPASSGPPLHSSAARLHISNGSNEEVA